MKQDFIERNFFAVFKTLQVAFIIFACIEAAYHNWWDVASNLLFAVCIETFIKAEQSSRKVSKKVEMLFTWNKVKGEEDEDKADNSENPNLVKIKKGCNYLCLKSGTNISTGRPSFIKGKIYQAPDDDVLVEEDGSLCDVSEGTDCLRLVE